MKRLSLAAAFAAALLATGCSGFKPNGEYSDLRGRVFSLYYNSPLENAEVSVPGYSASVRTNAQGYFELKGLPTEWHETVVSAPSHRTLKRQVQLDPFGSKYVEFWVGDGPAGKPEIVFERNYDIWLTDQYGMQQRNLTEKYARNIYRTHPVWSGDKQQIGFVAYDGTQRLSTDDGIWTMQADGTMARRVAGIKDNGRVYHLDWSHDGSKFLYMLQNRMFIFDTFQGNIDGLSSFLARPGSYENYESGPVWTPDGSTIVTSAHNLDYAVNFRFENNVRQIFVMNQQGVQRKQLTREGDNYAPAVSPDGREIAYISSISGQPEVWIMGLDGSNPRQITHMKAKLVGQPRWTKDGQFLLFTSNHMQQYRSARPKELWIVDRFGNTPRMVTNDAARADG
jgi:Tol biopolymer transport system component